MNSLMKASLAVAFFACLVGVIALKLGVLDVGNVPSDGLTGMVSVKGSVSAKDLGLTESEVKMINRTVESHKAMFTQVDVFLDSKGQDEPSKGKTVLVMALVLETDSDCEVRSWSRKVTRKDFVSQVIVYMNKAAKEYEQFKKHPDVKQNFKCLYI